MANPAVISIKVDGRGAADGVQQAARELINAQRSLQRASKVADQYRAGDPRQETQITRDAMQAELQAKRALVRAEVQVGVAKEQEITRQNESARAQSQAVLDAKVAQERKLSESSEALMTRAAAKNEARSKVEGRVQWQQHQAEASFTQKQVREQDRNYAWLDAQQVKWRKKAEQENAQAGRAEGGGMGGALSGFGGKMVLGRAAGIAAGAVGGSQIGQLVGSGTSALMFATPAMAAAAVGMELLGDVVGNIIQSGIQLKNKQDDYSEKMQQAGEKMVQMGESFVTTTKIGSSYQQQAWQATDAARGIRLGSMKEARSMSLGATLEIGIEALVTGGVQQTSFYKNLQEDLREAVDQMRQANLFRGFAAEERGAAWQVGHRQNVAQAQLIADESAIPGLAQSRRVVADKQRMEVAKLEAERDEAKRNYENTRKILAEQFNRTSGTAGEAGTLASSAANQKAWEDYQAHYSTEMEDLKTKQAAELKGINDKREHALDFSALDKEDQVQRLRGLMTYEQMVTRAYKRAHPETTAEEVARAVTADIQLEQSQPKNAGSFATGLNASYVDFAAYAPTNRPTSDPATVAVETKIINDRILTIIEKAVENWMH